MNMQRQSRRTHKLHKIRVETDRTDIIRGSVFPDKFECDVNQGMYWDIPQIVRRHFSSAISLRLHIKEYERNDICLSLNIALSRRIAR